MGAGKGAKHFHLLGRFVLFFAPFAPLDIWLSETYLGRIRDIFGHCGGRQDRQVILTDSTRLVPFFVSSFFESVKITWRSCLPPVLRIRPIVLRIRPKVLWIRPKVLWIPPKVFCGSVQSVTDPSQTLTLRVTPPAHPAQLLRPRVAKMEPKLRQDEISTAKK